jgi:hypothetical protein
LSKRKRKNSHNRNEERLVIDQVLDGLKKCVNRLIAQLHLLKFFMNIIMVQIPFPLTKKEMKKKKKKRKGKMYVMAVSSLQLCFCVKNDNGLYDPKK